MKGLQTIMVDFQYKILKLPQLIELYPYLLPTVKKIMNLQVGIYMYVY